MRYNADRCAIETSVRRLCALTARGGDLDSPPLVGLEAFSSAIHIHQRLQGEAGGLYSPEVSLVNTTLWDGMYYTVSGRADGVIRLPDGPCVDEIKCVRSRDFYLPPRDWHMAQLKCYAYFLGIREGLDRVRGRMTYYNMDSDKIRYFNYTFQLDELRHFYMGLLDRAAPFARAEVKRELDVLPAAAAAVFPYRELREGQEIMVRECYGAIKREKRLFVEAPTGTGKTISSLFPAVRALGEKRLDKIFYMTAKASTRREAYSGVSRIFSSGVGIRAVVLNSKESMCRCPSKGLFGYSPERCNSDDCPLARGYYDRAREAVAELLEAGNGYPVRTVLSAAERHGVCPYELSLDLSEYCDVIICDYNYAFDPSVYLRRYFADGGKRGRYAFLVDEAHNLADRARDMYSSELRLSQFCRARDGISEEDGDIDTAITSVMTAFSSLRLLCRDNIVKDAQGNERGFFMCHTPLSEFLGELDIFKKKCDKWLSKNTESAGYEGVFALSGAVRKHLCVNEYFDKGFLCYVELGGGDIIVKTYCLDPSAIMDTLLNRAVSSVLFSATLTPAEYFCDVLGSAGKSISVSLPSPFECDNLCVAVADRVSTRLEDRAANLKRYVTLIAATVSAKKGNYMVYFPSYGCLEEVYEAFAAKYPKVETVVQKRGMGVIEREQFLSAFKEDSGHLRVGFCVLGGAFSEGVDLPGSRLIGAIIFGVGLPGLSNERNIIRDYFDGACGEGGEGYDYAYTYPGMNNVLQAAGRVIRTDSDRGIVVLVDDRYGTPKYRRLFPKHWKSISYAGNTSSLAEIARRFWSDKG